MTLDEVTARLEDMQGTEPGIYLAIVKPGTTIVGPDDIDPVAMPAILRALADTLEADRRNIRRDQRAN